MGLDMWAFTFDKEKWDGKEVDTVLPRKPNDKDGDYEELDYWRKHHDLHGWMHNRYQQKGGADPDFNCNTLILTNDDLDDLERAIRTHALPPTTGFFFGNNPPDEDSDSEDLEFVYKARQAIKAGKVVAYYAWY